MLGAAFWGTLPLFSRYAYANGADPVTAAAWRAYMSAGIFALWFLLDGTFKRLRLRQLPFYFVYGVCGVGGTFLFYMLAIERLSTAMAVMLLYTAPAFVIVFSRVFYGERITKKKIVALLATAIGCFFVVRAYDAAAFAANFTGIVIGLLSGICYSMVTILGRKAQQMHEARTNAGLMMIFGMLAFLFLRPPWRLSAPTQPQWLAFAGLALFGSVLAYISYLCGLSLGVDGGTASLIATAEPVIATALGALVYGDTLEVLQILGMGIVLAGVALLALRKDGAQTKKALEDGGMQTAGVKENGNATLREPN